MRHFDDSRKPESKVKGRPQEGERQDIPAPDELALGNQLGDSRMLVAGGILDQPYMLWQMAVHARWVWDLLTRWADRTDTSQFTASEELYYKEVIDPIRRPWLKQNE